MALIEVRGLTKFYNMGSTVVRALDGVDLTIEPGEFVAITGPSGSGKSTMMHVLGCLDRPTGGTYLLAGRNVGELSDRELATLRNKQIGFVFQTFNLMNRTSALENVAVPLFYARKTNTRTPALRALERVGLAHRASHNPNELSGGERQRVAIARAIVNDPALVLADEPTGNLDSRTGAQIIEIFRELNRQGVTVVIVTHESFIARQAQRVVVMRDGKIVADRPASELPAVTGPQSTPLIVPESDSEPLVPTAVASELVPADPKPPLRPARGTTASLVCGLVASGLLAVVLLAQALVSNVKVPQFDPTRPQLPPAPVLVAALASCAGLVGTLALGIAAIALSMGARKRMRTEPGTQAGGGRALLGLILGWLVIAVAVGLPVAGIVINVVRRGA